MQVVFSGICDLEARNCEEPCRAHSDLAGIEAVCQAFPAGKAFYFYYTLCREIG